MGKTNNLQPLIEYFNVLKTYEKKGFLETDPGKHMAYITRAALFTLTDIPPIRAGEGVIAGIKILNTVRYICAYVDCLTANTIGFSTFDPNKVYDPEASLLPIPAKQLKSVRSKDFALHVVTEDASHDLLYTLLLTRRRRWWWPFYKKENIYIINYEE